MQIKYAVYSPTTGENIFFDTKEESIAFFWNQVISLAKSHCHNTSYMVVQQNDDGTEVWYNDNNDEIDRPKTWQEMENLIKIPKSIDGNNVATVEVI